MRRIVMFNRVTVDGQFGGPSGELDWVIPEPELDRSAVQSFERYDAMLFGRRTYQMFESYWPHALDDAKTAADPHADGRRSTELRTMAVWINEQPKLVFSRSLKDPTWKGTRVLPSLDPGAVEAVKREPGKDIILFGSGEVVRQLTDHHLIDEYHLILTPRLMGRGHSLLAGLTTRTKLKLLESKPFPSGNVLLRYATT